MKIGKLTRDVKIASTGFSKTAGGTISENEVPPAVWELWVKEGIIIFPQPAPGVSKRERAAMRRRNPAIR